MGCENRLMCVLRELIRRHQADGRPGFVPDVDGHPVRLEERVRHPVGRPKGRRDTYQRQRRGPRVVHPELEEFRTAGVSLLDPDFDAS